MTGPATLLVLGGTGFFGKSILDAFRHGLLAPWGISRVIAAARRPDVLRDEHPDLVGPGVDLLRLDVATAAELPRADVIVHAANTTDARRYAADPLSERTAILAAADNFVRLAAGNVDARIVYASSGAVYGAQPADVERLDEDRQPGDVANLSAYKRDYAEAKLLAEAAVAQLGTTGIRVAVARCFAFVGPYLPRDQHFAVGNFLADGIAGRQIAVAAQHPVMRSYMYADDLVRWLMTIAMHAGPACSVYNVGSDQEVEVADLAVRVAALYGVPVRIPLRAVGPVDRYVPAIAKAATLGLTLDYDLDTALATTVARLAGQAEPTLPSTAAVL